MKPFVLIGYDGRHDKCILEAQSMWCKGAAWGFLLGVLFASFLWAIV